MSRLVPGDTDREFEELPIREWDPGMSPEIDDIRIRRGRLITRRIMLDCIGPAGQDRRSGARSLDGARPLEAWVSGSPTWTSQMGQLRALFERFSDLGYCFSLRWTKVPRRGGLSTTRGLGWKAGRPISGLGPFAYRGVHWTAPTQWATD